MSLTHRVIVLPEGRQLDLAGSRPLLFELADQGLLLRSDCGGKGRCNKCRVVVAHVGHEESVNSCEYQVKRELTLRIPEESRLSIGIIDKAPLRLPESYPRLFSNIFQTKKYGVAIDLGTTTIAFYLCELETTTVLAAQAYKNPQALYGADVMNRISAINGLGGDVMALRRPLMATIEAALADLCPRAGISVSALCDIVVVGNPAMIHILVGEDPESIGVAPYQPKFTEGRTLCREQHGQKGYKGKLRTLPLVSGFIGADTVAAMLAVDLSNQPVGTLLVDLGTNGEIVLLGKDCIYATSCATGPAFEGATISCGMQAEEGAIDHVEIDAASGVPKVRVKVDNPQARVVKVKGICGSGVVSAIAAAVRTKVVESSGALSTAKAQNFIKRSPGNGHYYELVAAEEAANCEPIFLSQKDIRAVQLGKAALRAGIEQLLLAAGLKTPAKILVAGAFGSHIEAGDMVALGMLPAIPLSRIETVGNAAGSGAVMALCNADYLQMASNLAAGIKTIDLAASPAFQKMFITHLQFSDHGIFTP